MVQQHGNPHATRDFSIPSRDVANWSAERSFDRPTENQFHDPAPYHTTSSVHPKGLSIENALKQCVGLHDLKDFCLLTVMRNGEKKNYSSDHLAFQDVYRQFNTDSLSALPVFPNDNNSLAEFEGRAPNGRRHRKQSAPSEDSSSATRRRRHALNGQEDDDGALTRKRHRGRGDEDEQSQPIPTINTQQLSIGDDEEVTRFYVNRFKDLQQNACKVMGKVFVKLVEPKKQTHYPYTKGASKCPPWWPPTTGENYVRHKEPDHLLKHERIKLLVHILLMIVEPVATQAPAVTKLGLNVKKLEDVTMEAMNAWFNDKDHPANAKKRPYLKEIFKVAKQQERYKNGEIDESCKVNVVTHDGLANASDDDEPDEGDPYDEAETAAAAGILTPNSNVSPTNSMMQSIQPVTRTLDDNSNRGDPNQQWRQLPMRGFQAQTQGFGESKMDDNQSTSYQPDPFRHKWEMNAPSYPPPPNDPGHQASYQPQQQQAIYNWQPNPMPLINTSSNGPPTQPYYVTSPQSASSNGYQLPPPATLPQQNMLPPLTLNHQGGYDSLQNGNRYDTGPAMGAQLRTGSLAHPYSTGRDTQHHGGYQEYLNEGMTGYGQHESMKEEQHQQQQHHHIMHSQ